MSTPLEDLRDNLQRRRAALLAEVSKIETALGVLLQPGVAELLSYVDVSPYQPGSAPILTIRPTNGSVPAEPPPKKRIMGRSDKVLAAMSTDTPKNSIMLMEEIGMPPMNIRSAFKVLLDQGRITKTSHGYYVRKA